MITSAQIRAARALIRMTSAELAEATGLGIATIRRIELGDGIPPGTSKTLHTVKVALETAGVEFVGTPEDRPGVRKSP